MPGPRSLADAAARDRIRTDTSASLFVEAGAGSGKTASLVDRVVTLALDDAIPVANIAAVTFTEKAGAELRDRLRARFETAWRSADGDRRVCADQALMDLDAATIGTLHSFAQRILSLHPIEAGLPPLVEVLDEVASSVAFDERWSVVQRQLLDDDAMAEPVLLAMAAGVRLDQLRALMKAFNSDWDLVEDCVLAAPHATFALPDLDPLLDRAAAVAARRGECTDPADRLCVHLDAIAGWASTMRSARDDEERFATVQTGRSLKATNGRKANWADLDDVRADLKGVIAAIGETADRIVDSLLHPLAQWIGHRVIEAADGRAAEGRLEFHDLLVLTRRLLRRNGEVRAALQAQYPRLLLDEFQDTDPIQIELAVRIAAGVDGDAPDWHDIPVPDGSLFVVGDPKQSIYRFRRADIRTYLSAQDHIGERVSLTTNFRTTAPVLTWVNAVFGTMIQPVPDAQPRYQPLDVHRLDAGRGPSVSVLGAEEHVENLSADRLREAEAAEVAAIIAEALSTSWTVHDPETGRWRPIRPGDIAVLLPGRTSLPHLQDALDGAGIAYRAEASSLVYQASEIRDLMAAARVIADPTDLLSCVTALRSQLFGCGDDDLWTWKRDGGSFHILADPPAAAEGHPVGRGLAYLRSLHRRSPWDTPSELLAQIIADRRMFEVGATASRARDTWRRLRFVVDQARSWSEVEHGGLRGYLAWAARQADETARVAEAVQPETDVDAVRIMTVHAAKGLEFGMVVLSGMTSAARQNHGVQVIWPSDGGYAIRLSKDVRTIDFLTAQPLDEQMDDYERVRLLYVAATRARDHLVVSLHRTGRNTDTNARRLSLAWAATGAVAFTGGATTPGAVSEAVSAPPPAWEGWLAELEALRAAARRPSAISASGLEGTEPAVVFGAGAPEEGAAKGPRDIELPPWSKGRYGSAIGRAVHGVLQIIDLTTGSGLPEAVAAQCLAEGVSEYDDVVGDLVRSALNSPAVQYAAARSPLRESWVATVEPDGTVLEGIVDLLYRDDDGTIVVLDYKTDAIPAAAVGARVAFYRPQVQAYLRAMATATGARVRGVLLFLHPAGVAVAAIVN